MDNAGWFLKLEATIMNDFAIALQDEETYPPS
jgi:hypothetical protein